MSSSKAKKAMVTGAAGFVGRALIEGLLERGFEVMPIVRSDISARALDEYSPQVVDIKRNTDWKAKLEGIDVVYYLSARVHIQEKELGNSLDDYCEINLYSAANMAQQAASVGVKRFVYLSTIGVNGFCNEDSEYFSEDSPVRPHNNYSLSKWWAEECLRRISKASGIELVILRPPLVYGPNVKANFLKLLNLIRSELPLPFANISNSRSFVYIGNLVDALCLCGYHPMAKGETFLISDNEKVSSTELLRQVAKLMGKRTRIFYFPISLLIKLAGLNLKGFRGIRVITSSLVVDNRKIRDYLGWEPPFTLSKGLEYTVDWYVKHGYR